jgi:hypothetical protein
MQAAGSVDGSHQKQCSDSDRKPKIGYPGMFAN